MKQYFTPIALVSIISFLSYFLIVAPFAPTLFKGLAMLAIVLTGLWLVSLRIRDAGIIDVFWGIGFVLVAWLYYVELGEAFWTFRNTIVCLMVTLWGTRLAVHLGNRYFFPYKGEDYRYGEMRAEHGKRWWWWSLIQVFLLQGVILWIVSSVFMPILLHDGGFTALDLIGIIVWAIGLFFEAVGDWQLRQFKKNPDNTGKVLDTGLWKYTRHPNYFGDALLWWGFYLMAFNYPQGIFFFSSPLFMTFLLMRISGVAMLEVKLKKSKPQYHDYIKRTSAFFPMPPK